MVHIQLCLISKNPELRTLGYYIIITADRKVFKKKEEIRYKSHPSQTLAVWLRVPINNSLCVNHKSRL